MGIKTLNSNIQNPMNIQNSKSNIQRKLNFQNLRKRKAARATSQGVEDFGGTGPSAAVVLDTTSPEMTTSTQGNPSKSK
jgi:hypothetical protein